MSQPKVDLKDRRLALILAWMVPGLGHVYQGRVGKGILYGVCILSLFVAGLSMGEWKIVYWRWISPLTNSEQFCYYYLGQFWAGLVALPALIQATLIRQGHPPTLGGFMAEPSQDVINGLYGFGKFVEIGSLYTFVAGLLNILAMYDAYEGPAHPDEEPDASSESPVVKPEAVEVGVSS